ncbi:hypothetical protein [Moorena sp. SIO3H5]|uniref:hypothetical protein n=1 Tax=Moorena sp. SIO3H5 TaxID=2607834 RepID=UPI0013BDC85B|nr:hypothetical protein [Moorena sp. SIO3H5]NEO73285.1 hypothetical protein [Moorena sp. SIO3H5]
MKSFLERASGCGVGIRASGFGTGILPVSFPGGQDAHSTYIDSPPSHLAVEQASCLFHFQAGRMPTPLILIPPLLFPIPDSRLPTP